MKESCEQFRRRIAEALFGELGEEERTALDEHERDCGACRGERERLIETVDRLRIARDVSPPRHFFIHPSRERLGPMQLLGKLSTPWKIAFVSAALVLVCLSALALTRLHVRAEGGRFLMSFGGPPAVELPESARDELLRSAEERYRSEDRVWTELILRELDASRQLLVRQNEQALITAVDDLETRVGEAIREQGLALRADTRAGMDQVARTVQARRRRDLAELEGRMDLFAAHDRFQSRQTDSIIAAVLHMNDADGP